MRPPIPTPMLDRARDVELTLSETAKALEELGRLAKCMPPKLEIEADEHAVIHWFGRSAPRSSGKTGEDALVAAHKALIQALADTAA